MDITKLFNSRYFCMSFTNLQSWPFGPPLLAPAPKGFMSKEPVVKEIKQLPIFCVRQKALGPKIWTLGSESPTTHSRRSRQPFIAKTKELCVLVWLTAVYHVMLLGVENF